MLLSFLMAMGASARATVKRGLGYAPGDTGKLDVYAPIGADGEAPVVVFSHSGWPNLPDTKHFAVIGQILASRGFVTVIPDFHVFPNCRYPDFVQDIAKAAAWARDNCAAYGGDPKTFEFLVKFDKAKNEKPIIPENRSKRCWGEYQQARLAFNLRIMPYVDPDLLIKVRSMPWLR